MTNKQMAALERLENDGAFRSKIDGILNDKDFLQYLIAIDTKKGDFSPSQKPSIHSHIQSERYGALKGFGKYKYMLLNLIEITVRRKQEEREEETQQEEYLDE